MDQTTLYIILGVLGVIGVGLLLWRALPWRDWAVAWVGNDINRCKVYDIRGEDEKILTGRFLEKNDKGMLYRIQDKPKPYVICVPHDYTTRYVNGYRKIVTQHGDVVALAIEGGVKHEPIHLVSSLVLTSFLTTYVNRIGKQGIPSWLIIILVVAGVGVLGFFVYQQFFGAAPPVDPGLLPSPTPSPTNGIPVV